MEIQINNSQRRLKINKPIVSKIIKTVFKNELKKDYSDTLELSINFINDKKIQDMNKSYLNEDRPTDVIAFALGEGDFNDLYPDALGDIFISTERAIEQSNTYNKKVAEELALYIIHGSLHILQYDDIDPKKKQIMRQKERYYSKKVKDFVNDLIQV